MRSILRETLQRRVSLAHLETKVKGFCLTNCTKWCNMDFLSWLLWLIVYYNQWGQEGYIFQLSGSSAGRMCREWGEQPSDCRTVLAASAPRR